MKRKLNIRALIANLMIMTVLAGMMTGTLHAQGLCPHVGDLTLFMLCVAPLFGILAMNIMKVRFTHKKTGEVREVAVNTPVLLLYLLNQRLKKWTFIAGINKEVWENHIMENVFPNNSFLEEFLDESEYINYLTVHTPNAGSIPTVQIDPSFPLNSGNGLAVTQRADNVVQWNIHIFWCGPFLIANAEEVQLSYNKRESILYNMEMQMRRVIAENLLVYCAPTGSGILEDGVTTNANIYRTSGITNNDPSNVVSSPSYLPGTTGNRLNYTLWDFANMKTAYDLIDIPEEDRNVVMSPNAERQLINDMIATKYRASLTDVFDLTTGRIDRLMGFKIFHRSKVMSYNNATTPVVNAYGASANPTDNDAMFFWQKGNVAKAIGDILIYEQLGSPTQGGDIYSVLIRAGATKKRLSELGVSVLVQSASA